MASTTYFGWETPDDTDLVKDGALSIRTLGSAVDTSMKTGLNSAFVLQVQDQKTSGTDGGAITAGAWRTHVLNTTIKNTISGASLGSNQFTLPAGTYYLQAENTLFANAAGEISNYKSKIANITDGTDTLLGSNSYMYATSPNGINVVPTVSGFFTIAGTKTFELQNRVSVNSSIYGYGVASSFGTEVYANLIVWKVG